MTGVIYARYSSDNQRDESIDGQIRECQAFAERQGISIVDHYINRAFSAKTDKRPAFQKMIRDSEKQKFDKITVWKLDHFARNRYDSAMYKNKLKKNNVTVASATETISSTSEGMLLESILEGYAEYYSAELAEKVTRGMTENALKCQFNGGSVLFGVIAAEATEGISMLIAIAGVLLAWIFSWFTYAIGEIVDKLTEIEENTGKSKPKNSANSKNAVRISVKEKNEPDDDKQLSDLVKSGEMSEEEYQNFVDSGAVL